MKKKILTRVHLRTLSSLDRRLSRLALRLERERRPWADSTTQCLELARTPITSLLRTYDTTEAAR